MLDELRAHWETSKFFRIVLVITLLFTLLRLIVQVAYLALLLFPEWGLFGGVPDWVGAEGSMAPIDLEIYMNAAEKFQNRAILYQQGSLEVHEEQYPYTPLFAFITTLFLGVSDSVLTIFFTLLHIVAYLMIYIIWDSMFQRLGLRSARETLALTLPVWLVFTAFWSDLGYLNVYIFMVLLATLLIRAILNERLGMAILWLTIILQIKPHWSFAAVVPLLLGRRRFFLKLILFATMFYLSVIVVLMVIVGPVYIGTQYLEYSRFLGRLGRDFPWRDPSYPFLGYNHSIKQVVFYFLGINTNTMRLAVVLKLMLLVPLGWISFHYLLNPIHRSGYIVPRLSVDLIFVFYLGAFIWLDVVWELSLGIVVFTYLLATTKHRNVKVFLWIVFLPYAAVDTWQVLSFIVWGMKIIVPGPYILTDFSLYVPVTMIVILGFYTYLICRLWPGSEFSYALPYVPMSED